MPVMNMFPGGTTLQIPLDAPAGFTAKAGNAQVTLTWTDPKDKYATPEGETAQDPDQLVSVWDHTVLVRKTGSQPAGPNDGTVVVSSSVRNQYQSTGYTDTGLTNDTTYYYGVFAYNKDGVASEGAFVSAMPMAGMPLSELVEGTLITINENGSQVEFYLAKHNYEPELNGQGRVLVVRKECISNRQWNSTNVNTWATCSLRSFLNGSYKSRFTSYVQNLMATTTYRFTPGNGNDTVTTRADAIFIMSLTELGKQQSNSNVEGYALPISSILIVVPSSVAQWTRSPDLDDNVRAFWVRNDAYVGNDAVTFSNRFPRPVFSVPSTALVDSNNALIETV